MCEIFGRALVQVHDKVTSTLVPELQRQLENVQEQCKELRVSLSTPTRHVVFALSLGHNSLVPDTAAGR